MTSPYDTPLWLEALNTDPPVTYSARQDRTVLDALTAYPGIVRPTDWLVSQHAAGANFTVDVAPGSGFIDGTSIANQGTYLARSTAVATIPVTAAPASGTRTDLIVARILDPQSDGQASYGVAFVAVAGPDTAGTPPPVPANAVPLARLSVASGQSAIAATNITDLRSQALPLQGPTQVRREITNYVTQWTPLNPGNTLVIGSGTITPSGPCMIELDACQGVAISSWTTNVAGLVLLSINNQLVRTLRFHNHAGNFFSMYYPAGNGRLYLPASNGVAVPWQVSVSNDTLSTHALTTADLSYAVREIR